MALNTLFPRQRELVNYDYFDIAEGVGFVVYYGLKGDAGEFIVSTTSTIYSEEICSIVLDFTAAITFEKKFDLDFDLTFNRPKNIKGIITANIPIGIASQAAASTEFEYYAVVKVYHFDGSETLLATGTSRVVNTGAIGLSIRAFSSMIAACRMDIATLKHFKKGETLRFTVEGWFRTSDGIAEKLNVFIGHDPKNRIYSTGNRPTEPNSNAQFGNEVLGGGTITYQNTQMIFHVPFVLDI